MAEHETTRAALDYARAGLCPVPIPYAAKAPRLSGWQELRLTEDDVPTYFNGAPQNVGLILGASGLVDVDCDTAEAVALAPLFLPPTRTFGRASKPRSHYLYRVDERTRTERFQLTGCDGAETVVEYRDQTKKKTSVQTVVPPSTHPSGEQVRWDGERGEPFAEVDAADLRTRVRCLAGVAALARLWPRSSGGRHDAAGALASVLSRSDVPTYGDVPEVVRAVARVAGDDDLGDRERYAADTVDALRRGQVVTGVPRLADLLCRGDGDRTTLDKALGWVGFDGRTPPLGKETRGGAARSVLDIRTGGDWLAAAAGTPEPRQLWGPLWFGGETTILFSESNAGKSVLAVQVADAIASGRSIPGFPTNAEAQPVLYLDFELSAKQFERRYSRDFSDPYPFHPNFHRAEIDPDVLADEQEFDVAVRGAIEAAVVEHGYRVVVVDNLTFLSRQSQEAKDALPLMRALHRLKRKHGLSMLVIGHTPKRDGSRPLTLNDLGGSRHLANFADAVVGLGRSVREPDVRYLKQLKVRSDEQTYHGENVAVLRLEKPANFLGFTPLDVGPEAAHLKERADDERAERDAAILDLRAEGRSYRQIQAALGVSKTTVQKVVHEARAVPDAPLPWDPGTPARLENGDLRVPPSRGSSPAGTAGDGHFTEPPVPGFRDGQRVLTPHGIGTVTAPPVDGRVSVEVHGLPGSYPLADVTPA